MALSTSDRDHFAALSRACRDGDCRLVEWHLFGSGQRIPGVCAVQRQPDGPPTLVPLALLFTGKPSTTLIIPHPEYSGFAAPEEILGGMPH
jgi:hypothetical protein